MILTQSELEAWGERLGAGAVPPLFILLRGDVGAGKSVLAREMARGAGVHADMPSPTYNLLHRYRGAGAVEVVHLDLYRLDRPEQVWELGWRELGDDGEIVIVEWPERAAELLPADAWDIELNAAGPDTRSVRCTARGAAPAPTPAAG
jgi:tRNA threonylcarbamoyladenosine biosynthesis protein TsaE